MSGLRQVVYRWVVSYIVQEVHADRLSLRDYYQIFSADYDTRRVLRKSADLRPQREKLFMEMIIAGVIKETRYTFRTNDYIYNFKFDLKGSIGLISNGHISLLNTTSTFSVENWDIFECFMKNLPSTENFTSEVSKFEESLTRQNKLLEWDEYLNLRVDLLRDLLLVLPCQFQAGFPNCLAHKVSSSSFQPLPLETDLELVEKATAILLALNAPPFEARSLAAYSNNVDIEYFEGLLEKSRRRKEVYGDIDVDI